MMESRALKDLPRLRAGLYEHRRGGRYRVIAVVRHSETLEPMVLYQSVDGGDLWVRPYAMWHERVEGRARFRWVGDDAGAEAGGPNG